MDDDGRSRSSGTAVSLYGYDYSRFGKIARYSSMKNIPRAANHRRAEA